MIRKQPTWFLILVTGIVVALDQVTKWLVVSRLALYESWAPIPQIGSYVRVTHTNNTGAAFGILPQGGLVFAIIGVVVSAAIIYYFHQLPPAGWGVRAALGLQLGGALGNLIDRFRQGLEVTDFIHIMNFPVFNVADSAITVGVGLLILLMILEDRQGKGDNEQPQDAQDESEMA